MEKRGEKEKVFRLRLFFTSKITLREKENFLDRPESASPRSTFNVDAINRTLNTFQPDCIQSEAERFSRYSKVSI